MNTSCRTPQSLKNASFHYCPGCGHGIVHRLIAEVIDELKIRESIIGTAPVGCAVLAYDYFDFDIVECAHGRPLAVATGLKRVHPELVVFTYQGDGDLIAIGTAETVHAAARSECVTSIFINNAVYGMTGGQMAPTTIIGQRTTTTPLGRKPVKQGYPIKVCELLATLEGSTYIIRVAINTPTNVIKAKQAIKKAFQVQIDGLGFSLVEILSMCPSNWGMSPVESAKWIEQEMIKSFPLGEFKSPVR